MWSLIAVGIVFLCLVPWAKDIYHIISQPMLAQLPKGGRMIATEITSPFFIPFKVTFLTAVLITLPFLLYQAWAFVAPGLYVAREAPGRSAHLREHAAVLRAGWRSPTSWCFRPCFA